MNHKISTIVIVFFILISLVIITTGFEIGEGSYCDNGEFALTEGGFWECREANYINESYADGIYCKINGNCTLDELTVTSFINLSYTEKIIMNGSNFSNDVWIDTNAYDRAAILKLNKPDNRVGHIMFYNESVINWVIRHSTSDDELQFRRHNPHGSYKDTPMSIDFQTGDVTFDNNIFADDITGDNLDVDYITTDGGYVTPYTYFGFGDYAEVYFGTGYDAYMTWVDGNSKLYMQSSTFDIHGEIELFGDLEMGGNVQDVYGTTVWDVDEPMFYDNLGDKSWDPINRVFYSGPFASEDPIFNYGTDDKAEFYNNKIETSGEIEGGFFHVLEPTFPDAEIYFDGTGAYTGYMKYESDNDRFVFGDNTLFNKNVSITKDLNVSGDTDFQRSHMWGLATADQTISQVDTWYNVSFNGSIGDVHRLDFTENTTVIIQHEGHYAISFGCGVEDDSPNPASSVAMRITKNNIEILGSYIEYDISRQDSDIWLEHTVYEEAEEGDFLNMQYIGSDVDISLTSHNTYSDNQGVVCTGFLREVTK